jgi:hypothetical protein
MPLYAILVRDVTQAPEPPRHRSLTTAELVRVK